MRLNIFSKKALYLMLFALVGVPVSAQTAKQTVCKAGNVSFTCPDDFEKLPNIDDTTNLFKFQYKDALVYFFVANPTDRFDPNSVMNAIAGYYSDVKTTPYRWKELKEPLMMSMRTLQDKQVASWIGFDGTNLITFKTAMFKIDNKNIVLGYAWELGRADNKQGKFKKGEELGDQSFGCNALATTLNSITREFPQSRQYCFTTGAVAK